MMIKKRVGYGWLYNWFTTTSEEGLAPEGWKVPNDEDFNEMIHHLITMKYGRLYTWPVTQKTLITGFTVPTDAEWTAMTDYIDTEYNQSPDEFGVGNHLKSRRQVNSPLGAPWATEVHPRWNEHATEYGRDTLGFSVLPNGRRSFSSQFILYHELGSLTTLWTSTEWNSTQAWFNAFSLTSSGNIRSRDDKRIAQGIPLLRNATAGEQALDDGQSCGVVTDYDGNKYNTIKIDDKVWTQQNFAGTHYANGDPIPHVPDAGDWDDLTVTSEAYCNYDNDENNVFVIKKKVLKVAGKVLKI